MKKIIIISVVIIIIIGSVIWWMTRQETDVSPSANEQPSVNVPLEERVLSDQEQVERLARIFLERAGSYSSQNRGQNVESLRPFVSDNVYQQLKKGIGPDNGIVSYATAKLIAVTEVIVKGDDGSVLAVGNQTVETNGKQSNQELRYRLMTKKITDSWQVVSFQRNP
ncbi:MAG: hypothetical protein V1707_01010 [bacterium]